LAFAVADVVDAGTTIVEHRRKLAEAYRREEAIAQILKAITQSSDELQPVLNLIAETAARICRADSAHVFALECGKCRLVASNRSDREFCSTVGRAVLERRTIHIPDATIDSEYGSGPITVGKNRTVLAVSLLREDTVIGAMAVARRIVEPFSDEEIELVTAFGDLAVIAIEGVRKNEAEKTPSRELSESLEYQTATADVLEVMARARFVKFTETGEVRVTAKAVEGHFAVSIADTGPDIPEHERARIFEQFHQIDNSNTKAVAPVWAWPLPSRSLRCTGAHLG
jgi:GAF domain-containing protein